MILKEIIEKCSSLNVYEKRCMNDTYCELVFYSKDTAEWNKIFVGIFGQAMKSVGEKPAKDDLRLTKDYGGINNNQTLFKKELDNTTVMAMFWPWQNAIFTTLKVAVSGK